MSVPWRLGQWQRQFFCELLRDDQTLVTESGERSRCTSELQHQRFGAQPLQARARAMQRGRVFGELQSERHRQRMLQPCARDGSGLTVLCRLFCEAGDSAVKIVQQRIDTVAQLQHGSGIDDVLTGRAPMNIARRFGIGLRDIGSEHLDQRDGEVAGLRRGIRKGCDLELSGLASL